MSNKVITEPKSSNMKNQVGDLFRSKSTGEFYILARVHHDRYVAIHLGSGNRFVEPAPTIREAIVGDSGELEFYGRDCLIKIDP